MPKKLAGTPIYAPINAHLLTGGNIFIVNNLEHYKKDDLESMMYVLI